MKRYLTIICIISMLLTSINVFSQEDEENPDAPPSDPGQAPIDDYIPLLIIGATIFAFRFLPKSNEKQAE